MSVLVDTSVWSLAFRRDQPSPGLHVRELTRLIKAGEGLVTTGIVLQELLQGFSGPRDAERIVERFAALPFLNPDRRDHIDAAALRNHCRMNGIQVGTIDALLAQICIRHDLDLLSTDNDFAGVARFTRLRVWAPAA